MCLKYELNVSYIHCKVFSSHLDVLRLSIKPETLQFIQKQPHTAFLLYQTKHWHACLLLRMHCTLATPAFLSRHFVLLFFFVLRRQRSEKNWIERYDKIIIIFPLKKNCADIFMYLIQFKRRRVYTRSAKLHKRIPSISFEIK